MGDAAADELLHQRSVARLPTQGVLDLRKAVLVAVSVLTALAMMGPMASATDGGTQVLTSQGGTDEVGVGLDDNGTATAVWDETYGIYYASRELGGRFGVAVPIKNVDTPSEMVFHQSPNGNAIVVWTDVGGATANVRAAVRIGQGNGFGPGEVISGSFTNAAFIDAAISDSGRAVVGWTNGGSEPAAVAVLSNGGTFAAPVTLEAGNAALNTKVGIDGSGNAIAVWDHDTQSDDRIEGAVASLSGSFGPAFTIEQLGQGAGEPEIDVNNSGAVALAYEDVVPADECTDSCSLFRVETRFGDINGTFNPVQPTPVNNEAGYGPGAHEVVLDESNRMALLTSTNVNGQANVLARVSDESGILGPVQVLSDAAAVSGPTIGNAGLDIDAGGGEFTAAWVNDDNGDNTVNEVYQAETTGGTFGASHQVSPTVDDSAEGTEVARDGSGRSVVIWDGWIDPTGYSAAASPVEGNSALTLGTETKDRLKGTSLIDEAFLGGGDDIFNGAGGNDLLNGEAGNDKLTGAGGADILKGGPGNDILNGGSGKNRIIGGPGRDVCHFNKGDVLKSCERKIPITV